MKNVLKTVREIKNIRTLVNKIKSDVVGWFAYKGKMIFIGHRDGKDSHGLTRKQRLYRQRRSEGLCVECGIKVEKRNPKTRRLYRLCDHHRYKIDWQQK